MEYIYAVSVVSFKDGEVNNLLYNGVHTKENIIKHLMKMVNNYKPSFKDHIVLVNCNLSSLTEKGGDICINKSYDPTHSPLSECMKILIKDIEQAIG